MAPVHRQYERRNSNDTVFIVISGHSLVVYRLATSIRAVIYYNQFRGHHFNNI